MFRETRKKLSVIFRKNGIRIAVLVAVASCGVFASCLTMTGVEVMPPAVAGAKFVGNEECGACHEKVVKAFPRSVHARIHVADSAFKGESGCESCHGPGSKHIAGDGDKSAIVNPGKSSDACYRCHFEKKSEFNMPYHHPLEEGKMTCNDCHDPHGANIMKSKKMAMARGNDACGQCHKEQTGPKVFEHEAMREGCQSCHAVHGSINKKMLVENDANLCLKCHTQVQSADDKVQVGTRDHSSYFNGGTRASCWIAGCHTAVHGSSVDSHLRY